MKKVFQFIISTILTIGLLFGLGFLSNPSVIFQYQIWVAIAATITMFATQPKVDKADFLNISDHYSMLGIMVMAIVVTNITVIEFGFLNDKQNELNPLSIIGFIFIWGGLIFRIYSIRLLGNYFSNAAQIKNQHQLFQGRIYSLIRHPSYTGAISSIIGTVLWLNAWQTMPISLLLIFAAYYHRITQEEKVLTIHFGKEYQEYCERTGTLLPKWRSHFFSKIKFIENKMQQK
jgi:protein-S-isoprenylcysteine O-methyltransferase Ste14